MEEKGDRREIEGRQKEDRRETEVSVHAVCVCWPHESGRLVDW